MSESDKEEVNEDIRKRNLFKGAKETYKFIKSWDVASHFLVWGVLCSVFWSFHKITNYFNDTQCRDENRKLIEQISKLNINIFESQTSLKQLNLKYDSLSQTYPLTIIKTDTIHDTLKVDGINTKASKEPKTKFYSVSAPNIKAATSFNDKILGVSITLSNITADYNATAIYDIPEPFGTIHTKGIVVSAGKFWKFKKNGKNYKLVISKIDFISATYGIELYEYVE